MAKLTNRPPAMRLDAVIERTIASPELDGLSRIQLDHIREILAEPSRNKLNSSLNCPNLADALIAFVMPSMQHTDVLHAERHRALLERLAHDLAGSSYDNIVREGALVIRRELRRLAQLRRNSNSLVQG